MVSQLEEQVSIMSSLNSILQSSNQGAVSLPHLSQKASKESEKRQCGKVSTPEQHNKRNGDAHRKLLRKLL